MPGAPDGLALLLGSHVFLTVRTGFIQRKIPQVIRVSWINEKDAEGDISNFGALSTALAATIGTGFTVVICLLTGVVLVSTMLACPEIQSVILENPTVFTGAQLSSIAFSKIPFIGTPILVLGMVAFSYSTILGWSYYGSRCADYLFGARAVRPYQVVYVLVAYLGAIGIGDSVWLISDIGNALMAIPNIIVVLAPSGLVARETKHYVYDGNLDELSKDEIPTISNT